MKFSASACIVCYLFVTGSSQPMSRRPHPLGRQHPRYGGRQQQPANYNNNLLTALMLGFDVNELLAFQSASGQGSEFGNLGWGNFDLGLGNMGGPTNPRERQRQRQNMKTLSLLGIIDGPDLPDGPAGGQGRQGGRGQGPPSAGAAGAGAAGDAADVAPTRGARPQRPQGRPQRRPQRPRRRRPNTTGGAKK